MESPDKQPLLLASPSVPSSVPPILVTRYLSSRSHTQRNTNTTKLKQGDLILEQLGTGADAVAAARGLVGAEQNFNPFAASIPTICSDPTLPTNELLRGVVPLVDPAVDGSDVENANAAKSLETPFDATGLSVAEVMAANGFTNFSTKDASGAAGASPDAGASTGNGGAADVAVSQGQV